MVISSEDRKRAQELAGELVKITGGRFKADGKSKTFAEIEDETIQLGDLITSLAINQTAAENPDDRPPPCCCPQCGTELREDNEPVILQTDRGDVQFMTNSCYCRHCRRSFFPSAP